MENLLSLCPNPPGRNQLALKVSIGFYVLAVLLLGGCTQTDDLPLLDMAAQGDTFAREFIDEVAKGEANSAYAKLTTELQSDNAMTFLEATGNNIGNLNQEDYKIVEQRVDFRTGTKTGPEKLYSLGYEYPFDKGYVLFLMSLREKDGETEVTSFNVDYLPEPLSNLTAFNLNDKSALHYLFIFFGVAVPFFVVTTMIVMLRSNLTGKKKILWALLILLVNMPQFAINWATADVDFSTLSISLLGVGISRPALFLPWIFSFSLPIGAAGYWFQAGSNDALARVAKANEKPD